MEGGAGGGPEVFPKSGAAELARLERDTALQDEPHIAMWCWTVKSHGDLDTLPTLLERQGAWNRPVRGPQQVLVKVLACSLAPGDVRVLRGQTSYMQEPASYPYIPGSDFCGRVEEPDPEDPALKVGDLVVGRFPSPRPFGFMAEYAVVGSQLCVCVPEGLQGALPAWKLACLPSSAPTALRVLRAARLRPQDRVLVVGASGGVGGFLVQLLKKVVKVQHVTVVSSVLGTPAFVDQGQFSGVDQLIDRNKTPEWWVSLSLSLSLSRSLSLSPLTAQVGVL
jgi:NADPH:quinone reductase-like Zn-dependent oxidoreductase